MVRTDSIGRSLFISYQIEIEPILYWPCFVLFCKDDEDKVVSV